MLYGFNVQGTLPLLAELPLPQEDFNHLPQLEREQAENWLAFVNTMANTYYDKFFKSAKLIQDKQALLTTGSWLRDTRPC